MLCNRKTLPGSRIGCFDAKDRLWVSGRSFLVALQAAGFCASLTQGIGLRPKPWAGISRPIGPVPLCKA
jgi:hypothetical protein